MALDVKLLAKSSLLFFIPTLTSFLFHKSILHTLAFGTLTATSVITHQTQHPIVSLLDLAYAKSLSSGYLLVAIRKHYNLASFCGIACGIIYLVNRRYKLDIVHVLVHIFGAGGFTFYLFGL